MDFSKLDVISPSANRKLNTVFGKYTAFGVTCTEIAVNNVVARVHVKRLYFHENKSTSDLPQSKMMKGKKRTLDFESDQEDTSANVENHVKKRGRPRKQQLTTTSEDAGNENANLTPFISVKSVEKLQCLNGEDGNDAKCASGRVRKPNPKFQDFVVSSPHNVTPETLPNEKSKESLNTSKNTEEDDDDPLALPGEVVNSFLPVFETPHKFDSTIVLKNQNVALNKQSIEKENRIAEQKEFTVTAVTVKSPEVVASSANTKTLAKIIEKSATITPVKSKIMTPTHTLEKTQKGSLHSLTQKTTKTIPEYKVSLESLKNQVKIKVNVNNGSKPIIKNENSTYALVESANDRTRTSKPSEVDFNKLVRCLKSIKLPASNWKIRIVVSRQQTITEVAFTNKEANERCVKFSRNYSGYIITFGKSVVKLHGAPNKISSFNDVTILLDIIHNIELNDPVLEFSNKSLVK